MKVKEVLTEGMIKLPEKLWSKLAAELHSAMYSYLRIKLNILTQQTDAKGALKMFDEIYQKHFPGTKLRTINLKQQRFSKTIGKISADDIPEYAHLFDGSHLNFYFDDKQPLRLEWEFDEKNMSNQGTIGTYYSGRNSIKMNLKNVKKFSWSALIEDFEDLDEEDEDIRKQAEKNVKEHFAKMIDIVTAMEYTARHEMTHFVQFSVLARGHADQIKSNHKYGNEKSGVERAASYYLANIEFGPQIITAVGEFVKDFSELKRDAGVKLDWKPYAQFVAGAISSEKMEDALKLEDHVPRSTKPYSFFGALKTNAPVKWKKATKLFYQELEKKFK